jgi:tetratricopeptide (TPR) repeat protein
MDHDVPVANSWYEPLGIVALIGIVWLVLLGWWVKNRHKAAAFGLFWYLGGLVPVSNFLPLNTAIAEHYLYIPSVGFFLAAAVWFEKWSPPHLSPLPPKGGEGRVRGGIFPVLFFFGMALLISLMSLTFLRTLEWGDEEKLYLSTIKNTHTSFRANNNLGVYYFRKGEIGKAGEYFKRSLAILPTYAEALNNLGAVYQKDGDFLSAIDQYQKSVEANPNYLLAHQNLFDLYAYLGRKEEADKEWQAIQMIQRRLGFPLDKP